MAKASTAHDLEQVEQELAADEAKAQAAAERADRARERVAQKRAAHEAALHAQRVSRARDLDRTLSSREQRVLDRRAEAHARLMDAIEQTPLMAALLDLVQAEHDHSTLLAVWKRERDYTLEQPAQRQGGYPVMAKDVFTELLPRMIEEASQLRGQSTYEQQITTWIESGSVPDPDA